ncbi:MAG: site-specific integrase [Planctomycetes bacterium]|nr:site-specific integrase [Planctomycetota bacterium]
MRGLGRVFQRGPWWWIALSVNGREIRESSSSTERRDAEKLLKARLAQIQRGTFADPTQEKRPFTELLDMLTQDNKNNGRKSAAKLDCHIVPVKKFFLLDRICDVTATKIESYKTARLTDGKANATINRELAAIRRALRLALQRRMIAMVPHIAMLKENNVRTGFVNKPDLDRIAELLPQPLADFARFAFLTAWRRGEIASLEWRDVELAGGVIRVRPENSKSGHAKLIALEGELREVIQRRSQDRPYETASGEIMLSTLVFHRRGSPIGDFRKLWIPACEKAGIPNLLIHDLCRSGIRAMIRAQVPERIAQEISGRRTRSILDRYKS